MAKSKNATGHWGTLFWDFPRSRCYPSKCIWYNLKLQKIMRLECWLCLSLCLLAFLSMRHTVDGVQDEGGDVVPLLTAPWANGHPGVHAPKHVAKECRRDNDLSSRSKRVEASVAYSAKQGSVATDFAQLIAYHPGVTGVLAGVMVVVWG